MLLNVVNKSNCPCVISYIVFLYNCDLDTIRHIVLVINAEIQGIPKGSLTFSLCTVDVTEHAQ